MAIRDPYAMSGTDIRHDATRPVVYIYSYVIIVVWVLLQVVVAVLLENFFSATASDKEQTAKARVPLPTSVLPLSYLRSYLQSYLQSNFFPTSFLPTFLPRSYRLPISSMFPSHLLAGPCACKLLGYRGACHHVPPRPPPPGPSRPPLSSTFICHVLALSAIVLCHVPPFLYAHMPRPPSFCYRAMSRPPLSAAVLCHAPPFSATVPCRVRPPSFCCAYITSPLFVL
eukprot:731664-Rhodomonas_salina.1